MLCEIKPTVVSPATANYLEIEPIAFGPPPTYAYRIQRRQPSNLVGIPDSVCTIREGVITMSQADWDKWPADYVDDSEWQLTKIRRALGLKLPADT